MAPSVARGRHSLKLQLVRTSPGTSPPLVDPDSHREEHEKWLAGERAYLSEVLPVTGIWPIAEGETPFGGNPALRIALPAAHVPALAGTFRRTGNTITVTPAANVALRLEDGSPIARETPVTGVVAGPLRLQITDVGDERRWVTVTDSTHPAITNPPPIPSYPLDEQWRVAARFDAFDQPKRVKVPDVRGGFMEVTAIGQLVFRLKGDELRLTAISAGGQPTLSVWFKDETNGSTTYRGYRVVRLEAVKDGEWTVIDFNFAYNPPCAYSTFTTCPLPPSENRLPVAIEAGLKNLPSVKGY